MREPVAPSRISVILGLAALAGVIAGLALPTFRSPEPVPLTHLADIGD